MERTTREPALAPLPYEQWVGTKTTLHLFTQIVGKLQRRYTRHRNHWWNLTFRPSARGLLSHMMHEGDTSFDIEFDFIDHRLVVRSNHAREPFVLPLRDGLSVSEFYRLLFAGLDAMGLRLKILTRPYQMGVTTPFPEDVEHRLYDGVMVRRWWNAIAWTTDVLNEFGTRFVGKQSSPQLFWHGFDLAVGRFSGRPGVQPPPDDPVQREAYSREVIAFGFWPGDSNVPAPTFYTYTSPEPGDLTSFPLQPQGALWTASGSGHLGVVPYDVIREAAAPREALTAFFESGYRAGTAAAHWETAQYESTFIPKRN